MLFLSTTWGHRKRKPSAREPSPGEKWTSTLVLDSPVSRTVRNNACCISYPDDRILLQQPKLTETVALSLLPRIVLGGWWHSHKCCLLKPPHSPLGRTYIPIRRHSVSRTEMMVSSTKLQSSPGVPVPLCTHAQTTSQDWLCHPIVTWRICLPHKIRSSSWDEWEFQSNVSWSNLESMIFLAGVSSHRADQERRPLCWVGVIVQVIFTSSNRKPYSGSRFTGKWSSWR